MQKSLKFNGPDDSFWWVSDTHFNHKSFVYGPRGYNSSREHDDGIIHKWNEKVKTTDTVFFLGDFILSVNKAEDSLGFLRRLNFGTMIFLWGNHNASVKQLYQEELKTQYNLEGVELYPLTKMIDGIKKVVFVGNYLEVFVNNQHIINSHFSLRSWHKNGKLSFCCCGHSHGNDKGINPENKDRKIVDCGIDNGFPMNFREIKNIMKNKNMEITDHHGSEPIE